MFGNIPEIYQNFICFFYGLFVGSFLNVCIYRIPLRQSIVLPRSHCTKCKTTLSALDLIPVLTYIFRLGKCKYCGKSFSFRYPFIEILTATLVTIVFMKYKMTPTFVIYAFLTCVFIVIAMIDFDYQIIPDEISITGMVGGLFFNIFVNTFVSKSYLIEIGYKVTIKDSIFGLLIGFSALYFFMIIGAMGGGDVKLLGFIGAFLGYKSLITVLIVSFFVGTICGVLYVIYKSIKRGRYIPMYDYFPFGPYIVLGAFLEIYYGNEFIIKVMNKGFSVIQKFVII